MITIEHADCLVQPYETVDHVITDPPYSPKVHRKASTMRGGKAGKNDLGFKHLTPILRASIAHRIALARSWCVVFSDWEGVGAWRRDIEESGGEWIRVIPWVRWSMPQLSGDRPTQGSEAVIIAHGGMGSGKKKRWNGPGNLTHFDAKCLRGDDKHPTEKPLDLMLEVVHHFTEPGAMILDPCAGRGTTIIAAAASDRQAVGWEIDEGHAKAARERVYSEADLDKRDLDGWERWLERLEQINADKARCSGHTARVRAQR